MKQFQRIGVFLNDEPGDREALAFAARFAEFVESESVSCVLVHGVEDKSPRSLPAEDELQRRVMEQIPECLAPRTCIEVHADRGIAAILRCGVERSLDLIVVGRRLPHVQRAVGGAFTRLVRKAPCSVLVVPERAMTHFSRIQVLVDGSDHSRLALDTALQIARASREPHPQVIAHTIYEIGYGYKYTGRTFSQAVEHLENVWREKLNPLFSALNTEGVQFEVVYSCSNDLAATAYDLSSARNLDMIMLGSRGLTNLTAALIGATAEAVVHDAPQPVFVVKKKGETVRLLEVLLAGG